jgi:hypothetical protein
LRRASLRLFKQNSAEWSVDLLFKKPWTLSKKAEFMVGIGPEWDSREKVRHINELSRGRSRGGLHVLALVRKTQIRLVC